MSRSEALHFTHADPRITEAVVGRPLEFTPATLYDFRLDVQHAAWMPNVVRGILSSHRTPEEMERFSAFVPRQLAGSAIKGFVSRVTPRDLELVDNYELEGLWTSRVAAQPVFIEGQPHPVTATVHVIGEEGGRTVDPTRQFGGRQFVFGQLNDVDRMVEVATIVREAYVADNPE